LNIVLQYFSSESVDAIQGIFSPFIIKVRLVLNSALYNVHNGRIKETLYKLILHLNH